MEYNEEIRRLTADEGKWLTFDNQIFVKSIYLACSLTPDYIQEVSEEEKLQAENNANEEIIETETETI